MHFLALLLLLPSAYAEVSPACLQDLEALCTDHDYDLFTQYVTTASNGPYNFFDSEGILAKSEAAGMPAEATASVLFSPPGGTGAWDACPVLAESLAGVGIDTPSMLTKACMVPDLSMGFCLPRSCDPRKWNVADGAVLVYGRLAAWGDEVASPNSTKGERTFANSLGSSLLTFALTPLAQRPAVVCSGQTESFLYGADGLATDEWNTGRILMVLFCAGAAAAALVGTAIEHYTSQHIKSDNGDDDSAAASGAATVWRERLPALVDFSLIANANAVFASPRKGSFQSFDGLRTFSALWIVFGHYSIFMFAFKGPAFVQNPTQAATVNGPATMAMTSMDIAVDTFFVLSAFLATYFMIRRRRAQLDPARPKAPRQSSARFVASQYLTRYLRLTPLTVFTLLFFWAFLPMMGSVGEPGPYSQSVTQEVWGACPDYWWTSLVHLTNLVGPATRWYSADLTEHAGFISANNCFGQIWYISCEMQLFLLLPPLVLVYTRSQRAGVAATAVVLVTSLCLALGFAFGQDWVTSYGAYDTEYYGTPWMRAPTYLLGVLMAMLWAARDEVGGVKANFSRVARSPRLCGALLALALLVIGGVCYGPSNEGTWSTAGKTLWMVLKRPCWGLGIVLLSLLCFESRGHLVGWFLGSSIWVPLSTLSFAIYLVHLPIIFLYSTTSYQLRYNSFSYAINYLGVLTTACLVALVMHLLIEKPCVRLSKRLMARLDAVGIAVECDDLLITGDRSGHDLKVELLA